MKITLALLLMFASTVVLAQSNTPAAPSPGSAPETVAPKPAPPSNAAAKPAAKPAAPRKEPDRSAAYFHYSLAHIYEELVSMYNRSEYANKAIDEYKLA